MEAATNRKAIMLHLREELVDRLKLLAARDNRSLNNYVETILMDFAYETPNAATRTAIAEARNDDNLSPVDMSDYESFLKSIR
ncbi:MAG: hypothetical protein NC210_09465 [[Clostridium] fimetarium]|nr:toxin-antitoxin system protein [Alistipes timonensis]MCM1406639.1 hypothetical protein [[Clostridium] fimetarium]